MLIVRRLHSRAGVINGEIRRLGQGAQKAAAAGRADMATAKKGRSNVVDAL